MVVGSSVMGYFAHLYMNGQATGELPQDAKERRAFYLSGKQPNSILSGDQWISFQRFGPAGDLASLGVSIGEIGAGWAEARQEGDSAALTTAIGHATLAAVRLLSDEVGFMTLANLFEIYSDPKRAPRIIASELSTAIPFSSLLRQTASFMDPKHAAGQIDRRRSALCPARRARGAAAVAGLERPTDRQSAISQHPAAGAGDAKSGRRRGFPARARPGAGAEPDRRGEGIAGAI